MPDFSEFRYAPFEFRETAEGLGVIEGTVLRYGDVATFPWGTEEFKPGAFGDLSGRLIKANRQHDRGKPIARTDAGTLTVVDSSTELRASATLPDTTVGRDLREDIRIGNVRGFSVEFRNAKDSISGRHRTISTAGLRGFAAVDDGAYPDSLIAKRQAADWGEYRALAEGLELPAPAVEGIPEFRVADAPEWARQNCYLDHKGRLIFIGGDLDCRYEDFDLEERQMPRLRGRLPYNVDGITSMARNEHVRFLPGAFGDSLSGEVLALVGNDYDNPLGGTIQRSLTFADSDDALEFRTSRIPETSVNRDFIAKLRGGFVRGVTAGWALQGSKTSTEQIEGGGTRIVVEEAMLCELRLRTRSAFAGESIQASRRNEHRLLVV